MSQNNITTLPETIRIKLNKAVNEYFNGNDEIAFSQFNELVDSGYSEAYVYLAGFYEKGTTHVKADYSKAIEFYALAIETQGVVEAYLGLARMYLNGMGVDKDYCKAFNLYSELIDKIDDELAHLNIGLMYKDGLCAEVNYDKAYEHFMHAWENGYIFGLTNIGLLQQKQGKWIKGWLTRLKASYLAFKLSLRSEDGNHPLLRKD